VLAAAIHLADGGGIAALSMRRLAEHLGVGVMSLYYYFPSKEELLSGMLDVVFGEMELPASGGDWQAAIRSTAVSARDVLLRHAWACQLLMSPTAPSPARLRWMNAVLGRLRDAGFSADMTHHAYHAVDSHIVGFVLWVLPYLAIAEQEPDVAQRFLEQVPLAELPHLAEHIEQHMADRPGDVSEFEFGLDLILDGLERLRSSPI
jgi:AcrR family transcriptional regulator